MHVTTRLVDERTNWIVSQCSGTILDIGGNQGHVFRDTGLDVTLLDINEFERCEFPQVVADAHSLPFADNSFDITCLLELLEHVHNPILALKEAARVARKKVIFTVPNEYEWPPELMPFQQTLDIQAELGKSRGISLEEKIKESNPTLTKLRDLQQVYHRRWYTQELLESHLKYASLPYQVQTIKNPEGYSWFCGTIEKEQVNLNIGSFVAMLPPPWINLDILDLSDDAERKGFKFQQVDVTKGLPFGDKSIDHINCSHLIEHLAVSEGIDFLKECYRSLKPGGVVRICVPDTRKLVDAYVQGDMDRFNPDQPDEYKQAFSQSDKFWRILTAGHKTCYDTISITHSLELASFNTVNLVDFDEGVDYHPEVSLSIEGRKA